MKYGMVIDLKRCIGCGSCVVQCKMANGAQPEISWCRLLWEEIGKYPHVKRNPFPANCMHCANAPCVDVCPSGATTKREDGLVTVDAKKCVGCKYCMIACPYGSRFYNNKRRPHYPVGFTPYEKAFAEEHLDGTVEKCNFCFGRVDKGSKPACVQICPAEARIFGDLDDPSSEACRLIVSRRGFQLHPELGTDPSVYYLPP